ncbi:hypothetical protein L6452_32246 [Arctium lappa]|uniref:Uncharacterized protein n=1 Tax=Arctium lappa TaxID=4217 RepID=A0ACB8Z4N9_ARCLA|nr:hypothetical protein L6452_32246 [Arctium lappa]
MAAKSVAGETKNKNISQEEPDSDVSGTQQRRQSSAFGLTSEDIFRTLREMRKRSGVGGFEFMSSSVPTYYRNLKKRVGDVLSGERNKECEELGILVLSSCRRRHV